MKEVSLKSLKIALNFIESKNNPSENQIVGSLGPKCYNLIKALFFDIMPRCYCFYVMKNAKKLRSLLLDLE